MSAGGLWSRRTACSNGISLWASSSAGGRVSCQSSRAMASAIARLPGRKFIFTNGSRAHAEKVAARLGFTDHFEDIFDIVRSELLPKPARATYDRFVAATGILAARAAMFEDLSRNLEVPAALGMKTVLVVPSAGVREVVEDWEMEGRDAPHVDYLTDDLGGFLGDVLEAIASPSSVPRS